MQVYDIGKTLLGNKFVGVFPLDKIPKKLRCGGYIVNTDPSTQPGEHWIAFNVRQNSISVFDPFGEIYPAALVTQLKSTHKKINFNRFQCQNILTTNCGHLCLLWLTLQYM